MRESIRPLSSPQRSPRPVAASVVSAQRGGLLTPETGGRTLGR